MQDLADCPADLDASAVRGAVMENCAIQLSYRIKDPETAEWLAASTGTILVDDESRRIEKNVALAEHVQGERTVRLAERYFIDTNMIMNVPRGCGVLVGATKLPSFCYTSPVRAPRTEAAIMPTTLPPAGDVGSSGSLGKALIDVTPFVEDVTGIEPEEVPETPATWPVPEGTLGCREEKAAEAGAHPLF